MRINEDYLDKTQEQDFSELLPEFSEFLENASEETLDRIYDDYSWCKLIHRGGNILQEDLETGKYIFENESPTPKTYHPDIVCKSIKEVYPMEVEQTKILTSANNVQVILLVANVKNNADMIIRDMDFCGWYLSREKVNSTMRDRMWVQMVFEPYWTIDATDILMRTSTLYHITPTENVENIKKEGFVPKATNKKFRYPPRIHFFSGESPLRFVKHAAREISDGAHRNPSEYSIILLNTDLIPENIKFYFDPDYECAIYTYEKISPGCIKDVIPAV